MGSIYKRGPWWWAAFKVPGGGRIARSTGVASTEPRRGALLVLAEIERQLKLEQRTVSDGRTTVAEYALTWTEERKALKQTNAAKDLARVKKYVLPTLGAMRLSTVSVGDIRKVVKTMRTRDLAPRTILNTYGLMHRLFEDAVADELVLASPVTLKRRDLPTKRDKDPMWRSGAKYTRDEAQLLMTSPLVPADRRIVYALAFFTGMREGEIAALTWAAFDETSEPLPKLLVAWSFTRRNKQTKATKSGKPRDVPVHPELLPVLHEWRARGFASCFGRAPRADDLIAPNRAGGLRTDSNFLEGLGYDLEALGFRGRDMHSMRRTFISCAREDAPGSDAVLKTLTHDQVGNVYDGYTIFTFAAKCAAMAKLNLSARPVQVVHAQAKAVGAEHVVATSTATPEENMALQKQNPLISQRVSSVPRGGFEPSAHGGHSGSVRQKTHGYAASEGHGLSLAGLSRSNVANAPIAKELGDALDDFKTRGDRERLANRLRVLLVQLRPPRSHS